MKALKVKNKMQFICVSKTEEEFEDKFERAYWSWYGTQGRNSDKKSKDDFMKNYDKVELKITKDKEK